MKRLITITTTTTTTLFFLLYVASSVPAYSFIKAALPRARRRWQSTSPSSSIKYVQTDCCCCRHPHWKSTSFLCMTSQAVDLSSDLGTDASLPQFVPLMDSSATMSEKAAVANEEPSSDHAELGLHLRFRSKVLPLYGALFAAQAWLSAIVMFPLCFVAGVAAVLFDWRRMRPPAAVAQAWGRLVLLTMGCRPRVEGAELLPPPEEPVVFVANHGSYLDIPVTNFLPRLCKYLMKAELLWLPIVGWKAILARDIFVHRQTSATFRRLLQSTTRSLKAGNSIMTFPEGTRSKDGKLGEFKRGPFTMAQRAGARIVPITITGVAKAMPPFALAPLCRPQGVKLRVHPPISTKGRNVKEVMAEARRAVCVGLENWQQPSHVSPPPLEKERPVDNPATATAEEGEADNPSKRSEENPPGKGEQ